MGRPIKAISKQFKNNIMKTVKFKEPFESKLKKLRIKTKFVNNINKGNIDLNLKDKVDLLNEIQLWGDFIKSGFIFAETPEGKEFWYNISSK